VALECYDDEEVKRSMPMSGQVLPRAASNDPAETLASTLVSRLRPGASHVRARCPAWTSGRTSIGYWLAVSRNCRT